MSAAILAKLGALREVLPSQLELTRAGLALYAAALADLPLPALDRAIAAALTRCRWFPTPAELRELAGVARPEDAAIGAWGIAFRAIGELGAWRSVTFDDALITAAVRHLGGWELFCAMTPDEIPHRRRDFERAYAAFARAGISPEQAAHLPGLHERSGRELEPERVSGAVRLPASQAAAQARLEARRAPRQLAPVEASPEDRAATEAELRRLLADPALAPALREILARAIPGEP